MTLRPRSVFRWSGLLAWPGLLLLCGTVWATDYFVSPGGSDIANGLSANPMVGAGGIASGPFATLAPLARLSLQHGDRVLLACGHRYQGPLRISLRSTLPGVLTISRFGDCPADQRPVVDGRVAVAGFSGSGLRQQLTEQAVVQVFVGDQPLERARFPKNGYLVLPEGGASSQERIPANALLSGRELQGAVLHARTQEWFLEERSIVSGEGKLAKPLQYPLRPKVGIYLTGKAWMLGDGEAWSYDQSNSALDVRTRGEKAVSVVYAGHLLQLDGRGAVTVNGVAFDAAGGDAIHVRLDGVVNISDVRISRAAGNGIAIYGASYAQIADSQIEDVAQDGIFFAEVARTVVRRNTVTNAGLYLGPGVSLAAINAHRTQAATIEGNDVRRSAYIGIRFSGDARIRGNYVEAACLYLSDCSALYTWRRGPEDMRPPVEISGNAVVDVGGDTTVKFSVNDWFAGIYLDEWSRGVTVRGNVIANVAQGIYLHNARDNVVAENFILNARQQAIIAKDDAPALANGALRSREIDNRVLNNTVLANPGDWSLRKRKAGDSGVVAPWLFVLGVRSPGERSGSGKRPARCQPVVPGGGDSDLSYVAAEVYSCR